jgi:hypothetical protein
MRMLHFAIGLGATVLLVAMAHAGAGQDSGYQVGDRLAPGPATNSASAYREIKWDALIPADWDPIKAFKKMDFAKLKDSDPKAMKAMEELKAEWNAAPIEPKLDGARVRIPGFVVPLGTNLNRVKEFLLVPYFGACIHVPPPPANQMIHVFPKKPLSNDQIMGPVWVHGTLKASLTDTSFGAVGYRMQAEGVEPYKEP